MKKITAAIICFSAALAFTAVACSSGSDDNAASESGSGNTTGGTSGGTGGAGGSSGTTTSTVSSSGYSWSSGTDAQSSKTYSATGEDENAVLVSGGTTTLTDCTITKTGVTSDSDSSSFYGINAAVRATGGTTTLSGGTITTAGTGANAIVAYGGTVNVSGMTMTTTKNLSRGIHATNSGTIIARNCTITTGGSGTANNCSVIATDRGGGTVTVTGGTYTTTGGDSAVIYSTGKITAGGITGSSSQGEIGVIEGSNYIYIQDGSSISSGSSKRGLMILQSGSGDASGYNGYIYLTDSTLTLTGSDTPLIEICTSVTGTVTIENCSFTVPSGVLMKVDYNTGWSTKNPVAYLVLNKSTASGANNAYTGNVTVDSYGTATVTVASGVTWTGAYDSGNTGKSVTAVINGTWTLSANSYVDTLTVGTTGIVNCGGYTLTCGTTNNSGIINK